MTAWKWTALVAILALAGVAVFGQDMDPAFYGRWKLDLAKSAFGSQAPPKAGLVAITPQGWVLAMVNAKGDLTALAVTRGPQGACGLIGLPPGFSCEQTITGARTSTWILKNKNATVETAEIELLADNATMRVKTKITPPQGEPYTAEELWTKVPPPSPPPKKQ